MGALVASWAWLTIVVREQYDTATRLADRPTYSRVSAWLQSAECARTRGVFLAVCDANGALRPIEDVSLADDRGHTLLANVLARLKSEPVTRLTLTRANVVMNGVTLVVLSGILFLVGCRIAAVASIWFGIPWGFPGPYASADALGAFFAAFCLALSAPLLGLWMFTGRVSWWRAVLATSLGGVTLACAMLLRQPFGIAGAILVAGVIVVAMLAGPRSRARVTMSVAFAIMMLLAIEVTPILFAMRGLVSGVPAGQRTQTHGISHNLYMGLGTQPNPWGITWSDGAVAALVARVEPAAGFVSPRYYRVVWRLYFEALRGHPGAALRIYWQKTIQSLQYEALGWKLLIAAVLAAAARWASAREARAALYPGAVLATFVGLVLLQGVLAAPGFAYFYPAAFGANVLLVSLVDVAAHWELRRQPPICPLVVSPLARRAARARSHVSTAADAK